MRLASPLALLVALAAGGCSEAAAPVAPVAPPLLAVTANEVTPFGPIDVRACSGEYVSVAGRTHVLASEQQTPRGTSATLRFTTRGEGIAPVSGVRYTFHDAFALAVRGNGPDAADDMTDVVSMRLIGQGSAEDLHMSVRYRLKVSGNGRFTAETIVVNEDCR